MSEIKAEIIADSINSNNSRLTTLLLTYPRIIHSEFMTHRMFSRNSASSRAIPFNKMVEKVDNDPFIPILWQKDHKGMQGDIYEDDFMELENCKAQWLNAKDNAISNALYLNQDRGITKQLCNRLLEPFMWHQTLITATEFDNFFYLRCPKFGFDGKEGFIFYSRKQANKYYPQNSAKNKDTLYWFQNLNYSGVEVHMQLLAEAMFDAMNESKPQKLEEDEFHIPFNDWSLENEVDEGDKIKIAAARAARLSYNNFDGEIDYNKDLELYNKLFNSGHATPFEHIAVNKEDNNYYANFKGFKSLRKMLNL